jgi:hypothetical protein
MLQCIAITPGAILSPSTKKQKHGSRSGRCRLITATLSNRTFLILSCKNKEFDVILTLIQLNILV